jgi:hypothetical protein
MTPWIISARKDFTFFVASLGVCGAIWAAFALSWASGVAVYVVFQLAFNMPHNFQTWTLTVLDAEDREHNGPRYAVAAAIVVATFAIPLLASPDVIYPALVDLLLYWGYYHLVRQHHGILRLYERRLTQASSPSSARELWWQSRLLEVICYVPLLLRFRDPDSMTVHVGPHPTWVRHPILPAPLVPWLAGLYVVSLAIMLIHAGASARRGRPLGPRTLYLVAVSAAMGISGLAIHDFLMASIFVTVHHNIEYLGLVWFHHQNRVSSPQPIVGNEPLSWLKNRNYLRYAFATLIYGLVIFAVRFVSPHSPYAELPLLFVVAMHYYIDSRAWRFRERPALAQHLRL